MSARKRAGRGPSKKTADEPPSEAVTEPKPKPKKDPFGGIDLSGIPRNYYYCVMYKDFTPKRPCIYDDDEGRLVRCWYLDKDQDQCKGLLVYDLRQTLLKPFRG